MNKTIKWVIAAVIIIVVIAVGIYYSTTTSVPTEPLKIGAVFPLTGEGAEFGLQDQKGAQIAVDEINNAGGIDGRAIELIVEDSKSNPKDGVSAYRKLVDVDGAKLILGEMSSVSMPIAPLLDQDGVIFITAAANPDLKGDNVYRNFPTSDYQAQQLAEALIDEFNIQKLGILYINDDFGVGYKDSLNNYFTVDIIVQEAYMPGATDLRTQALKIINANPDAVAVMGYGRSLGLAIKELRNNNYEGKIFSAAELAWPDAMDAAGTSAEGVFFIDLDVDFNGEAEKAFTATYKEKYNEEPGLSSILGYNMGKLAVMVLENADYSAEDMNKYLKKKSGDLNLLGGLSSIDPETGDLLYKLKLKTIQNGQVVNY